MTNTPQALSPNAPRSVPIAAIAVGERDREELGNVTALAASIKAVGLLHPVVVTQALTLVAGDRRLAAVKQLGWTTVPVTVVDLETANDVLRAEADENTERKPLTPYEASRARERRTRVLSEDAAKRQAHGQTAPGRPMVEVNASAKLAEAFTGVPAPTANNRPPRAETRKVGAAGTGYSGSTLDKVDQIRDAAERGVIRAGKEEVAAPAPVVEIAQQELAAIKKTGAAVDRSHRAVADAIEKHLPPDPDAPHRKWRQEFLAALGRARTPMQFAVEDVATRSDDECIQELRLLANNLGDFADRVIAARPKPDNVRYLKAV